MQQIIELINEMSPYLLFGFLLAGLMHAFIPGTLYSQYLAKPNFRSVWFAAMLGIPLPLCSCGVIPTAMSLRKEGASKGATASFLIATPQTGVDSIIATFSLMGLPFAIIRPIAALVTALFGGTMVNTFCNDNTQNNNKKEVLNIEKHNHSCSCGCCDNEKKAPKSFTGKLKEALEYAFLEMMEDIGKWLVVGLIVAGLITVLVPDSFFEIFKDNSFLSMLLVLCFAVPMYLCATGSIPIAVALMMKGLTPGAGLVLLMAGPACNMASILVINKVMGRKTLITYLASIITGAVGFGLIIDQLLPRLWFISNLVAQDACCHEETSVFSWICTILLFVLLANALLCRHGHHHHNHGCCEDESTEESLSRTYIIGGMNCNHCRSNAEKALASCPGVTSAYVDLPSSMAKVEGNYDEDELRKAIESLGFTFAPQN